MSYFIVIWTLLSSLCSVITAIIAKASFGTKSVKLISIALIIYWILLGLLQYRILKPYISNAYPWVLATISGGIISSFLVVTGLIKL